MKVGDVWSSIDIKTDLFSYFNVTDTQTAVTPLTVQPVCDNRSILLSNTWNSFCTYAEKQPDKICQLLGILIFLPFWHPTVNTQKKHLDTAVVQKPGSCFLICYWSNLPNLLHVWWKRSQALWNLPAFNFCAWTAFRLKQRCLICLLRGREEAVTCVDFSLPRWNVGVCLLCKLCRVDGLCFRCVFIKKARTCSATPWSELRCDLSFKAPQEASHEFLRAGLVK